MHFASVEYALLLAVVFAIYWGVGRLALPRLMLLLGASYTFYAWWNPYYLLLIVASSLLDFTVGGRLHRCREQRGRTLWLAASVGGNLGLLGVFKYYNFFADSAAGALALWGVAAAPLRLDVLLPVGISFYTFQSMSYTIDIYRGELEPEERPWPFLVFVSFFPQLVAGPIVRARQLLPQLRVEPQLDPRAGSRGLFLIALGLLKKAVIADALAVHLVDRVFESPRLYSSAEVLAGVYGYAVQIYCDFSAYSDIAIGSALLLGLTLPQNFDAPYRAADLRDFWRRWHISLSSWLRDYLYIPLGGSRGSSLASYRNLALTMLLGGLWHGAAWTFVAWGALHGAGLALTRFFQRRFPGERRAPVWRAFCLLLTFHFVCLGWIFFRAPTFERAGEMLASLAALAGGTANVTPALWALLLAGLATHVLPDRAVERTAAIADRLPATAQAALLVAVAIAVRAAGSAEAVPFIYFQF